MISYILCKRESASSFLSLVLFVHFPFSPIKITVTDFLATVRASLQFFIHLQSDQVYCVKENQNAEVYVCLLFPFGPRQANLVLIAYASSEGSGEPAHPRSLARTSAARSYKQWVKRNLQTESQIPSPSKWLGMRRKFVMTECSKTQIRLTGLILFCFICHSDVIHRNICVKDFSGTNASRILKFGTNVGHDVLYCVNPLAYFLSLAKHLSR